MLNKIKAVGGLLLKYFWSGHFITTFFIGYFYGGFVIGVGLTDLPTWLWFLIVGFPAVGCVFVITRMRKLYNIKSQKEVKSE